MKYFVELQLKILKFENLIIHNLQNYIILNLKNMLLKILLKTLQTAKGILNPIITSI